MNLFLFAELSSEFLHNLLIRFAQLRLMLCVRLYSRFRSVFRCRLFRFGQCADRRFNAKLCVEAAIRTLPESEQPTTENGTETTVQANAEHKPQLGKSNQQIVEKFRGELGE